MAYGYAVALGTAWENLSPDEAGSDDWLAPLAVVLFLSAVVFFAGVMTARVWLVAPGFAIQAGIAVPVLTYAIRHWSDHADGQLVVYTVAFEVTGLLAVVLTARAGREPVGQSS